MVKPRTEDLDHNCIPLASEELLRLEGRGRGEIFVKRQIATAGRALRFGIDRPAHSSPQLIAMLPGLPSCPREHIADPLLARTLVCDREKADAMCGSSCDADGTQIVFSMSEPGEASAAIYAPDGCLVRTLLRGEERQAGNHTLRWDGLDRHGNPQPPDIYTWRVLCKSPFQARYIAMLGAGHPQHAPTNNWVGNHDSPGAIAVDSSGIYIGASVNENVNVLVKTSLDGAENHWYVYGRERWVAGRWQGTAAVASSGDGTVYMLQQNGLLNVLDAATGKHRTTWDLLPEGTERTLHLYGNYQGARLAAQGALLVICYRDLNRVCWIDTQDGSVQEQVRVDKPHDVAIGPAGDVFVLSDDRILKVERSGKTREVIPAGGALGTPARLAVSKDGEWIVLDSARKQVKRFGKDARCCVSTVEAADAVRDSMWPKTSKM
jgi:hypothetical protein